MPNALAYLMLVLWPFISLAMFRRMGFERALIWTLLGGYLALPPLAEFNLPLVPALDKTSIPTLAAALIVLLVLRRRFAIWPTNRIGRLLMLGYLGGVIPTVLINGDPLLFQVLRNSEPIQYITGAVPGLSLRDTLSVMLAQLIAILPFLMGRAFLSSATGLRELLIALAAGGLIYSIPALVEIRLSPQINIWVYGFFQHDFSQMIRGDGFRPIVFLPHGLWLALFVLSATLAAGALWRHGPVATRRRYLFATGYLAVLLVLCKSLAAFAYGLVLIPVILLATPKMQIRLALAFALVAVIYPMLRNAHLVPLDWLLMQAEAISPERAQSLGFRFDNEEQLLARAAEKPWFGWGGWGRNLLRDLETGELISVPDGRWIIVFGTFGWLGYISEFGLLALPVFLTAWQMRGRAAAGLSPDVPALLLILAITMVDMLLNATLIPVTWLCAGAILGHVERQRDARVREVLFAGQTALTATSGAKAPRTIL